MQVGICGEHGGEPSSISFFAEAGLDYVSCSPFRYHYWSKQLCSLCRTKNTYIYVYILQNWRINNIEPAERIFSYHPSCPFYRVPIARLAAAQVAV